MHNLHHKLYVIEGFNGMLYVFSSHCYCHPVIYSLSLFIIYSVNSFIANVICYITIPSLNKVLYLVSCILYLNFHVICIQCLLLCMVLISIKVNIKLDYKEQRIIKLLQTHHNTVHQESHKHVRICYHKSQKSNRRPLLLSSQYTFKHYYIRNQNCR